MNRLRICCIAAMAFAVAGAAHGAMIQDIITFEDIPTSQYQAIPDGYRGFDWSLFFNVMNADATYPLYETGYTNGVVSGVNVAYNSLEQDVSMTRQEGKDFDLIGLYLTAAWREDVSVRMQGLRDGLVVYEETVQIDPYAPTWFQLDFLDIETLAFHSEGGVDVNFGEGNTLNGPHFVLDDVTVMVPEPTSLLLLVAGAGCMIRRKRPIRAAGTTAL